MTADYDTIRSNYDITRTVDPEIARRIYHHLQLDKASRVLDIGCGTGRWNLQTRSKRGVRG